MSIFNIVLYPDDPLTKTAVPFDNITPDVADLAHDMLDTMHACEGVGLAGPQVGVNKRIFVLQEPEGEPMCLVNPEILLQGERVEGEEGCLSLPHVFAVVPRASRVQVRAYNELGKKLEFDAEDFLARIIQHEFDHLQGIVFPDRLDILRREDKLQEWAAVRQQMEAFTAKWVAS